VATVLAWIIPLAWPLAGRSQAQESPTSSRNQNSQAVAEELSQEQFNALIEEAEKLRRSGRYVEAARIWEQLVKVYEATLGPDHPGTATSLNNLAVLYNYQGLYSQTEPLIKRALAIREKALGPDHLDTAQSLNNLAFLYNSQGLYSKAEPLFKRALAIHEKALGHDHPTTATSLSNLASLHDSQGLYSQAEPLFKRALAIHEKALGHDHPTTAISLNNLASLHDSQGLYSQAELLLKRALAIREKALGPDHPTTATSLNNLAFVYNRQGLYSQAEPLLKRALAINEMTLGPDHPTTATSLNNLAFVYNRQGLYSQAEPLLKRALAISEMTLGPDHPTTANSLSNLASLYNNQGLYSQAEPLYKRALAISEMTLGPDHPTTATTLNNLAVLYNKQGLYSQAEPLFKRALAIREKLLSPDHLDTATSINNLALLNLEQGNFDSSSALLSRGLSAQIQWLMREGSFQPRSQREELISKLGSAWEASYSLADLSRDGPILAFSIRLLRHGLLLEIEKAQATLSRAPGPTRELAERVGALNNRIGNVQLTPEQRIALRRERDELETQLTRQWPDVEIPKVTPLQASAMLPKDGMLVEFQHYRPWVGGPDPTKRWGPSRYLALILKPDAAIRVVHLGGAEPIEKAIAAAFTASASNEFDAPARLAEVSDLVLKPLAPHLTGGRHLFLSPDGELHRVPFAALPSPTQPGEVLARSVQLRLITTGRDLVRFQQSAPAGKAPLVIANPNYDRGRSSPSTLIATAQPKQRSAELDNAKWLPLPSTAREGEQIASLLGTQPISGDAATVGLLQRSAGPKVLHIASHGFFVADQEIQPDDPRSALIAGGGQVARFQGEDPLLRSGIVLAGANNPGLDPNDDGLLTALEATALQLDGTELVVLSACSTGAGDIQSGEGLYGLQRALTVAGARTTLLSLWKVDDRATAAFMEAFYQRLKAGAGRADALADTQADFRSGVITSGKAGEDWSEPYYWAAWQLVGDWRPISGI
jgi:CHAT domain-containing protein/tetratricopeptide (TPR) repeat protein